MSTQKSIEEHIKELGQKVKSYRIMNHLTQQNLEDKSGVSKRSISRLEQGESVQMETLFKILTALGLGDNIELLIPDQTKRPSYYLGDNQAFSFDEKESLPNTEKRMSKYFKEFSTSNFDKGRSNPKRARKKNVKKQFKWGDEE